jgi:hypothetical protein
MVSIIQFIIQQCNKMVGNNNHSALSDCLDQQQRQLQLQAAIFVGWIGGCSHRRGSEMRQKYEDI